jgi:hypothetical protein
MSNDHDIILKDLTNHLADRVDQVLGDFVQNATVVDIAPEKMAKAMLSVLAQNVALLALNGPGAKNEPEFLRMCAWYYRQEMADVQRK